MTATTANDESGVVEYRFECISGPAGCTPGIWQGNTAYTASGLLPGSTYEFRVMARDAFLNTTAPSASAFATTPDNQAPIAVNDSASTDMDHPVTLSVLDNDSDPEGDALTIIDVTQGFNGSVTHTGSSLDYLPNPGFTGIDSFGYTIDDGFSGTASGSVYITVIQANSAPVASTDNVSINVGDTIVIDVLSNDTDPDGDTLLITAVGNANKGTVSWQPGDDVISYAHNAKRKGSDGFSYTISDGRGGTATGTVSISLGGTDSGTNTGGNGNGNGKGGGKPK
jgi:hypothetical protein